MNDKIIVKDVSFYYGNNQAIRDINLSVKENSVLALIGPSGCGKSTFHRCITG
jgi:phosphate transport system ATP-binding protein